MKLSLKMPLAFAAATAAVAVAALAGTHGLTRSIEACTVEVRAHDDTARDTLTLAVSFKTQVQEWKNSPCEASSLRA